MKTLIMTASTLLLLFIAIPGFSAQEHHPENETNTAATVADTEKMDVTMQKMQEMRKKIESEKNPEARKELMHQNMGMMKDCMDMMMSDKKMMGGKGMMMGSSSSDEPMNERMKMMENKMMMMQEIMSGMIMQQKMMMK